MSRWVLNISKERDSTVSVDKLCHCLIILSMRSLTLVLSLDNNEKSLAPLSLYPPFRYLYTMMRFPMNLFFSMLKIPTVSAFLHRRGALVSSFLCHFAVHSPEDPSCTGEPRIEHFKSTVAFAVLSRAEESPPLTCWQQSQCSPGYN